MSDGVGVGDREYDGEGEMLPDERAVLAERLGLLDDEERRVSLEEVAEELGFDLDE